MRRMEPIAIVLSAMIILGALTIAFGSYEAGAGSAECKPGKGPKKDYGLQERIDSALPGDTLYLSGSTTYWGNVVINKTLSLVGKGPCSTKITGKTPHHSVIRIEADWVNITGVSIYSPGKAPGNVGVKINSSDHCNISGNDIFLNKHGIKYLAILCPSHGLLGARRPH